MDERQRIQQVLSGNTSAFTYFVETYQDMAFTIAYRICDNMQDAEDVVQESFVKAYRNLHAYRGDSKFSTWLYRIVYNVAVTHAKSRLRLSEHEKEIDDASLFSQTDLQLSPETIDEQREIVAHVLDLMPKDDALILTLYYMEDNSVKEIANIIGLNEPNVKVKLHRARKLFKEKFIACYGKTEKELQLQQ